MVLHPVSSYYESLDWMRVRLSDALVTADPSSIVNSVVQRPSGVIEANITTAGAVDQLDSMAYWIWDARDILGEKVTEFVQPVLMASLVADAQTPLRNETIGYAGFTDRTDITGAYNAFGGGLGFPSGADIRRPFCWFYKNPVGWVKTENGSTPDNYTAYMEPARRGSSYRDFSTTGFDLSGAVSEFALAAGVNVVMTDGLYFVAAVGARSAVTGQVIKFQPGWLCVVPRSGITSKVTS